MTTETMAITETVILESSDEKSFTLDKKVACMSNLVKEMNDFTPEEEAQIREENKWCEE